MKIGKRDSKSLPVLLLPLFTWIKAYFGQIPVKPPLNLKSHF